LSVNYPFAALVGADELGDALLWLAVEPALGGVLVTGTRGTAKSTAVRALAALLPPIDIVVGDAFNGAPVAGAGVPVATIETPFVELPIGATEDRVIGTLDVQALVRGERRFEPGLLARANRGVLYVDEVNLLPDHLVDIILDAAATGRNVVERDGASVAHDARIMLVGTMNPEEGELRPQLLDRFGLCVAVENDDDLERRVAIVERRLAFERDPRAFVATYAATTTALRARIVAAREALGDVTVSQASLRAASEFAREARVEGMRADLTIVRAARAIAALDARHEVTLGDIARAAEPALAHRRREAPRTPPPRAPQPPSNGASASSDAATPAARTAANGSAPDQQTAEIGTPLSLALARQDHRAPIARKRVTPKDAARGRGGLDTPAGVARIVRHRTPRLAALATLRAAALDASVDVAVSHLRYIERRGRARGLVLFLVDASGSMAAAARMRAAKGAIAALLAEAYHRRDAVALVAFRGDDAELLVPPTRSAIVAYRRLRELATGGRTPLGRGLARARGVLAQSVRRDPSVQAHLVIVSDARANVPARDGFAAALHEAASLRESGVRALCVDTESGTVRLGFARRLASALDATYRHLDECSERTLGATVREWMATA